MKLALGLYGVYLLLVAINGNAGPLTTQLKTDIPHFLPWLIVAAVLGAMYNEPETHEFAVMFGLIVIITFASKNLSNLKAQTSAIYAEATGAGTQVVSALWAQQGAGP